MKCPKCQFENPDGAKFCNECGGRLELACSQCGKANPPGSKFCNECGHDLKESAETPPIDFNQPQSYTPKFLADKILTTRSSMQGERKLVTVFFADVANYTSVAEELDPEEVHQIMDGCFQILMDEIHRYEGTINQFTGDGVMALFGAPVAHEDHAQRACYAALSIQKAIGEYGKRIERDRGVEFKIRIGLNSGPVIVGSIGDDLRMDYTAVGDTTNLAARIQQAAKPGEVWASQETRNIIQDYFHNEMVGEFPLKGKAVHQPLYRMVSERPDVRTRFEAGLVRGITELVGRRPEMEALRSAFERAKEREGQVVDLVGEAGVGKSRLAYEFHAVLSKKATFLTGICVQHGRNINFLPVIDVVKEAFRIEEGMTEEEARSQIEGIISEDLAPMIPFYRSLLSLKVDDPLFKALNPEGRKFGTFEAVKSLLIGLSEQKPLVIFLEDVHWMDKISEEFFAYFSHSIVKHPILMLAAYRPEGAPSWAQGTHYQRLGLETLSSKSSIRLVRNILGGIALDPELEQRIVEKTGGNPFFVEEIVRELLERGDIGKAGDRYICKKPIDQCEIPSTVQGVLAAKMDRLSEDLKRTMQVASVIGRDFAFRLLKSIMELGEELRAHLTNLVGLEILYEKVLYPELEYIFKNALTQEVAYDSLLKQRRRQIHGRIARTIEELYTDRLDEHYEMLAHHYERSGNAAKAVEYLILAGEKSNRNGAAPAACEFFRKAFEISESASITLDSEKKVRVHQGLGSASQVIGDIDTALAEYKVSVEISRRHGLIEHEMSSLAGLAWTMWWTPISTMKDDVIKFFEEAILRAREVGNKAIESQILSVKGIYICLLSRRYDGSGAYRGNQIIVDAEGMALETGDPETISRNRGLRALSERWLGRPRKTVELTEGLLELMRSVFNLNQLSGLIFIRGVALAEIGRIEEGMEALKEGIDICEKLGGELMLGRLYNALGYCYQEIYLPDRAWDLNVRSEEVARKLIDQYPMGREMAGEVVAQASINLMENLFDQGKPDEAWRRLKSFEKEVKGSDYVRAQDQRGSRMSYLAAQILVCRKDLSQAEMLIRKNLKKAREDHAKKREGGFLRLLGEVQFSQDEIDNALNSLKEAIRILEEVGNPRQLWEAHASLATGLGKLGRTSDAREHWGAAAEIIQNTAKGLSDRELREGFLNSKPVQEILSKAEN
ncbi:MAG: AAA family ATPase [Deltaproteobacteria bacterium]|nr:MAG: AAA family ATPase [Deltaproteobacteria bacterium]